MIDWWLEFMLHRSFDFSLAFLVGFIIWKIREQRIPPQWACWLFAALLLKLVVPGFVSAPIPDLSAPVETPIQIAEIAVEPTGIAVKATPKSETMAYTPIASIEPKLEETNNLALSWQLPNFTQCVFWIWLTVVFAFIWRELWSHRRLLVLIRKARPFNAAALAIDLQQLQQNAGVTQSVRWLTADWAKSPMTYGLFRPVIITPTHWGEECNPDQARWILMHELAHIRRGDYAVFVIQRLFQIVYFFHPLVWWCNNLIHHLREYSCDEMAAAASDASPRDCGEGLLRIAALSSGLHYNFQTALGAADSEKILRRRLMRILRSKNQSRYSWKSFVGLFLILVSLIAFRSGTVNGQVRETPSAVVKDVPTPTAAMIEIQKKSAALSLLQKSVHAKFNGQLGNNEHVFQQDTVNVSTKGSATFWSDDGDVIVASNPDSNSKEIIYLVSFTLHLRSNNIPIDDRIIQQIKENVQLKMTEGERLSINASFKNRINPLGLHVSINLYALVPANMQASAISQDGDVSIGGMSSVHANSFDGDVLVVACSNSVDAHSGDGDIHVMDSQGPVNVETEDGDILIEKVEHCESLKTDDGDIAVNQVGICGTIITKDGDIRIESVKQLLSASSRDGDLFIQLVESPLQDLLLKAEEGDVILNVISDIKAKLDFTISDEGETQFRGVDHYSGRSSDRSTTGTLNGGGKLIKVEVEEGDILISSFK